MFHLLNHIRSQRIFSRALAVTLATYLLFGLSTDFNFNGPDRTEEPC